MSIEITAWELIEELTSDKQESLTGGADFELSGSNFANRFANLQGTTSSGLNGSLGNSTAIKNATATAAQDFLGLGGAIPTGVTPLGGPTAIAAENAVGPPVGVFGEPGIGEPGIGGSGFGGPRI